MRRLLSLVARFVAFLLFRRVEVADRDRLPDGRPVLLVANHFNGAVDAVLLASALPRSPRFLAKATLQRIPVAAQLLRALGVIFVHRAVDRADTAANASAFTASHEALRRRDVVAIFPEGTTHDRPHIDPVRTGAARIALGARASGAEGLVILPVGLTFDDKVSLRSSVVLQFGEPLVVDDLVPPGVDDSDVDAVRALTARIEASLRQVSPDFPDVESWLAFDQAAEVACRTRSTPQPSLAEQAVLARELVRGPAEAREAVREAIGRYAVVLAGLRIDDRDVIAPAGVTEIVRRAVGIGLAVVLLGSVVGATILVNAIPVALVASVSLVVTTPVTKGTARTLVGLLAFPAAWITAAVLAVDGAASVTGMVLLFAVGAAAALALTDRATALVDALLRWRLARERVATLGQAMAVRGEVVRAVHAATRRTP